MTTEKHKAVAALSIVDMLTAQRFPGEMKDEQIKAISTLRSYIEHLEKKNEDLRNAYIASRRSLYMDQAHRKVIPLAQVDMLVDMDAIRIDQDIPPSAEELMVRAVGEVARMDQLKSKEPAPHVRIYPGNCKCGQHGMLGSTGWWHCGNCGRVWEHGKAPE